MPCRIPRTGRKFQHFYAHRRIHARICCNHCYLCLRCRQPVARWFGGPGSAVSVPQLGQNEDALRRLSAECEADLTGPERIQPTAKARKR